MTAVLVDSVHDIPSSVRSIEKECADFDAPRDPNLSGTGPHQIYQRAGMSGKRLQYPDER